MMGRLRVTLASLLLLMQASTALAQEKPRAVQDLHYGEVLFHFYQDDYFTAITHLTAAQQTRQLQQHQDEAELLLGGMQLSYGLRDVAEQRFSRLLTDDMAPKVKRRAWYYLAKIAYQRRDYQQAWQAMETILPDEGERFASAEHALLASSIAMQRGADDLAVSLLDRVKAKGTTGQFLRINQAIAALRAGNMERGRKLLDDIGDARAAGEELRSLRDRANLSLGYHLLGTGDAQSSRSYLNRVRLQGANANAALLGAGWADVEQQQLSAALAPWMELAQRNSFAAPVQEAQLALAYLYEQIGEQNNALHHYSRAIDYFDNEEAQLDAARSIISRGQFLEYLQETGAGDSGGWLTDPWIDADAPALTYLTEVLAGHDFQESLKNYHDLLFMQQYVEDKLENMVLFQDMLEARRLANAERSPRINGRLEKEEASQLAKQAAVLTKRVASLRKHYDPLALATTQEQLQWRTLENVQQRLQQLPQQKKQLLQHKADWLQGVLFWQIQQDYPQRLWQLEKTLAEIQLPLQQAKSQHQTIQQLFARQDDAIGQYEERVNDLRSNLQTLLPEVTVARSEMETHLNQLALAELDERRERLRSYRNQARYALARQYDQLAQQASPP